MILVWCIYAWTHTVDHCFWIRNVLDDAVGSANGMMSSGVVISQEQRRHRFFYLLDRNIHASALVVTRRLYVLYAQAATHIFCMALSFLGGTFYLYVLFAAP